MPSFDYATESSSRPAAGHEIGRSGYLPRDGRVAKPDSPRTIPACVASTSTVSRIQRRSRKTFLERIHIADEDQAPTTDPKVRAWAMAQVSVQPSAEARGTADLLQRLVSAATTGLGLSGAVVTLRSVDDAEAIAAASDPTSRSRAELEFGVGEGPAHDAFIRGGPVLVPDLGGPQGNTWPGYAPAARAAGIGAVFAFPLQVGASRFGVLSLFADVPTRLGGTELSQGLALSELATEVLLDSSAATSDGEIDPDLKSALGFRSEIYQAQGMIMVTLGIALPEALSRMRAHAFSGERKLIDVSIDIVEGRLDLTDDN